MSVSNAAPSAVSPTETTATPALSRTNIILIVLLVLQLALTAYLFWPSKQAGSTSTPLLPGVTSADVTALKISDADNTVSFEKQDGVWVVAGTDGYPANADKINQTLDKLTAIKTDRLVTQTPSSHDRLQVADNNFVRKVELTTASGVQTLYLGSSTGASATHVRLANNDDTYLTGELATWELDTQSTPWINVTYYQVPKEQIQQVTLQNAHGTLTFVQANGAWTLADAAPGEPVAPANINTLIDRIATLNLHSVLGKSDSPDYGLATPLATITVTAVVTPTGTTSDTAQAQPQTKTTTFVVGAKDEANSAYYFKSSDSDFYVRLAAFTGDEFVNKQRSELMEQTGDTGGNPSAMPGATPPAVEESTAPTGTGEIQSQSVTTATLEASTVPTEAVDLEQNAAPIATVAGSEAPTVTASSQVTATVEATAEPTVAATGVATATSQAGSAATPAATGTPSQ